MRSLTIKIKKSVVLIVICIFIIIVFTSIFFYPLRYYEIFENNEMLGYRVVIDAGHGGIDGGAVGASKVSESSINLEITYELKSLFEKNGHTVILTRKDENGLYDNTSKGFKKRDLQKRIEIAKNANFDIFISIHLNKYTSSKRRGAQVFFKNGNESSKALAENVQTELNLLKESKRMYDALSGDYYLLNNLEGGVIIVECGFLSNPEEEILLLTARYRKSVATAIYNGATRYMFNMQKYL